MKSIRSKLLTFMCCLTAFVLIFGWLVNSLFLERFYLYSKGNTLLRSMASINQMYNSGEDVELEMDKMQVNQGVQVIIFTQRLEVRYYTWQNVMNLGFGRMRIMGEPDLLGFVNRQTNNNYEISRNYDERLGMEYLDLVGALDNGYYALLRIPIQTITDSAGIANRFLLITAVFSILVSMLISWRLSTQIARPIRAVEDIAKSMSSMDFSRRIAVGSRDEIGSLASSINALSDHLQETIEELQEKNAQLEEDIDYISKMDERRKEFLASVSHELKTPIALIQGYAEALEEKVVTSEENRDYYFHVISDEADKMNALVKKLVSLNNLEAGHDELYLEDFDVVALVRSAAQRGRSLPGAEELDFLLKCPEEAWVTADDFLIEEVVFNYITNAIHYAAGRKFVRITVRQMQETPGKPVRVEVFNSGSYLNDEERERVWESFYKADKSRSREYGGSGLGLSVVRAAMERHKCAYGVENIEDGVSFWFELPAASE
ncbi:MAG: HAMP domain-containing histidine kinase [Clostridiales bacterium]|nr:HAMP domain-containing histidine kinase [Clostridiales bacterium]